MVYVYCCIFGGGGGSWYWGYVYIVEAIVVIVFIGIIDGLLWFLISRRGRLRTRTVVALRTYFTFDVGGRRVLLWVLGFLRKGALFVYDSFSYRPFAVLLPSFCRLFAVIDGLGSLYYQFATLSHARRVWGVAWLSRRPSWICSEG